MLCSFSIFYGQYLEVVEELYTVLISSYVHTTYETLTGN